MFCLGYILGYTMVLWGAVVAQSTIPLGRDDSIVIVGGGPAGVHYATLLAKKGFTNIVIVEASDDIGGKSKTIKDPLGFPHELGTCYAHGLYTPVFDLLDEYDPTNVKVPFVATIKGHTWILRDNSSSVVDYNEYLVQLAVANLGPNPPQPSPPLAIAAAFKAYIGVHQRIFGSYSYGMPPQPTDWGLLNMTALQFLQTHKLMVLEAFFRYVFEQQGYGSIEATPAFYMLWWIHPDVIIKRMQLPPNQPWVYMLSKGYQSLWKAMVAKYPDQIKVQLKTRVTKITRKTTMVALTITRPDGSSDMIRAKHLVMAVDLSQNAPLPTDMQSIDASMFKGTYSASTFVVTLVETDAGPRPGVSMWWPYRGVGSSQGRLQLTRSTRLALFNPTPPVTDSNGPTNWGVNATGRQTLVTYQYYNRKTKPSDSWVCGAQLLCDLVAANLTNPTIRHQEVYNYAPRYNQTMLLKGTPWALWNEQGRFRTVWIGSSVTFESVLDVVTYNNNLIKRVQLVVPTST